MVLVISIATALQGWSGFWSSLVACLALSAILGVSP